MKSFVYATDGYSVEFTYHGQAGVVVEYTRAVGPWWDAEAAVLISEDRVKPLIEWLCSCPNQLTSLIDTKLVGVIGGILTQGGSNIQIPKSDMKVLQRSHEAMLILYEEKLVGDKSRAVRAMSRTKKIDRKRGGDE